MGGGANPPLAPPRSARVNGLIPTHKGWWGTMSISERSDQDAASEDGREDARPIIPEVVGAPAPPRSPLEDETGSTQHVLTRRRMLQYLGGGAAALGALTRLKPVRW